MKAALLDVGISHAPWADRRRRAHDLRERYPFAREVLGLYLCLLDAQEPVFEAASSNPPTRPGLAGYVARAVLPRIVEATLAAGPQKLVQEVTARSHAANQEGMIERWLLGGDISLVDRYLAGAACGPVLEAVPGLLAAPRAAGGRRCPRCGGLPQLSCFAISSEPLVTGPRYLVCSRCLTGWPYPRMTCAACGETSASKLAIYADPDRFPHLRVDGCLTCRRHLVTVDLPKDNQAVPVVDELAAIPLDLYARDQGMAKVVPNLMGI